MKPQTLRVGLLIVERGERGLSQREAIEALGCYRLAGRVHELRADGWPIEARPESNAAEGRHARYYHRPATTAAPMRGWQPDLSLLRSPDPSVPPEGHRGSAGR